MVLLPKQETKNICTHKMFLFGNFLIIHVYILMNIKMINKIPTDASFSRKCWTDIWEFCIKLICLLTRKQISTFQGMSDSIKDLNLLLEIQSV